MLSREEKGGLPYPFLKREKVVLIFEREALIVSIFGLNSIQNVVLRVYRIKNSKMFPCGASFSCVFVKTFIEVL